ncbi:MAG: excinuclease ABC subunit B [Candidatus Levybacteria bacterium RIFCSPLOWO2_01_FULL_38_21]|nr:MAG: excinuclease ABC subunit B [Candidatus Levybacteria bacterium RIFCSPLOWO2_01_FULL_38_21]
MKFKLVSKFKPTGDQPQAIDALSKNIIKNTPYQVLLGVTGSGKTFTLANVIEKVQKPTLVISHNKTLAAQLYQEFRDFFSHSAVSYFVSYYDYYQPEAYIPQSDTYIEKETEVNEEIDKLRLSATANLLTRKDVIVVASVSCIYSLGSPVEYGKFILEIRKGMKIDRKNIILRLTDLQYDRNEYEFKRGTYRVRGESIDVFPAYSDFGIRIEIKNNIVKEIIDFDPLTADTIISQKGAVIYPAKHYMTDPRTYNDVFSKIRKDLAARVEELKKNNKLLEAQRLTQRTNFDLQMIREVGYVNGIENYSRYFDDRKEGEPPYTLLDYFKKAADNDWLCVIDESHITLSQLRGMYNGDRRRKEVLIDYGFRLLSALDNRPLRYDEFMARVPQLIYVSATPNEYELSLASEYKNAIVQQLIRPTGLLDPKIHIRTTKNQIENLIKEITKRSLKKERVLVTTLTKRMAEDLSSFLEEKGLKVSYLHSDIATLDRQDVLDKLRLGEYDVIVGINLLREGLDLPEVSLVVILDADKEGFLRSKTSLIQTMGRAARHIDSEVILYADNVTFSMKEAIKEVRRRRRIQLLYNKKHKITPKSIEKEIRAKLIEKEIEEENTSDLLFKLLGKEILLPDEKEILIKKLRSEMQMAAKSLDFETASQLRDRIREIKEEY